MGIIWNPNAEWKTIHEAYGIKLQGKYAGYDSISSPEITRCITAISVNGRDLELGNRCIFAEDPTHRFINMEDDKDILCWYLAHTLLQDDYDYEQFWLKQYHNYPWKHFALEKKRRIEEHRRQEAEWEARKAKVDATIAEFQKEAERKGQRLIIEGDTAYFVKIDKRRHKGADKADDQMILKFVRTYPGNGIEIVEIREVV